MILDLSNQGLTVLPPLPAGLTKLYCDNNQLTVLPPLPDGLIKLSCSNNKLSVLPPLPPTLTYLYCRDNPLTVLPPLPDTLTYLNCSATTKLIVLPPLPDTLIELHCCTNKLTVLPPLPPRLTHLDCRKNKLTVLPPLPPTLTYLFCTYNKLTVLPPLPNTLTYLNCNKWSNPFIAPFDTFVDEFDENRKLNILRERVNKYYENKRKGRNLSGLMQTLGRTELQGRMALGKEDTIRNLNSNGSVRTLNKIPTDSLSVVGEFLTGIYGSVNQQRNALRNGVTRGGKQKAKKSRTSRKTKTSKN